MLILLLYKLITYTDLGTFVTSIVLPFIIFYIQKKQGESIDNLIKTTSNNVNEVQKTSTILRLDFLRTLCEISKNDEPYWRFRWRFETFNELHGCVYDKNGDELGGCSILIEGFSNKSDHLGFERLSSDFYAVKITKINCKNGNFPFIENERAACFCLMENIVISKGVDPWTEEPTYTFIISGLGYDKFGHGTSNIDDVKIYKRIIDCP